MTASHRTGGPGSRVLSGPRADLMRAANDAGTGRGRLAGLALCAEAQGGQPVLAIRTIFRDGRLGQALHVASHDGEVIALWRGLGRDFDLPLYLRDCGGVMTPVTPPRIAAAAPRRFGSALSGRRPRFLTRRKVPPAMPVPGRTLREG